MQIWLEIMGSFAERAGKYLICPVHSETQRNYPLYKILEDPVRGDMVFHYILNKASKEPSAFVGFSRVTHEFCFSYTADPLCPYPPPYRKVDLSDYQLLSRPITMDMLKPHRETLDNISANAGFRRTPFNKNFKIKQLYLSRIPKGFVPLFAELSSTPINIY